MFDDRDLRFDLFALALLALTVFLGLSLLTYSPADPLGEAVFPLNLVYSPHQVEYPTNETIQNACGHAGATCADAMLRVFGLAAYFVVFCLGAVDVWMLMRRPFAGAGTRVVGWLVALVAGVTLLQMFTPHLGVGPAIGPGGIIGAMGATFLESHFATAGSLILLGSLILGGVLLCTDYVFLYVGIIALTAMINFLPRLQLGALGSIGNLVAGRLGRSRSSLAEEEAAEYEYEELDGEQTAEPSELASQQVRPRGRVLNDLTEVTELETEEYEYEEEPHEVGEEAEHEGDYDEESEEDDESAVVTQTAAKSGVSAKANAKLLQGKSTGSEREEVIAQLEEASREYDPQDYELPPRSLLRPAEDYDPTSLLQECQRKSRLLEKTFEDFKLDVKVKDIETGPVIAQYEVALKRGLRLSKITGLADDLAIALRVPSVRIVAPIPGKNTVGIEVPNDDRQIVRMREVMEESSEHIKKMALPIFVGKDASGSPLAVDLAKMPHLLIAGRTGTGKSVCLNSIISSMLMTKTPDDVRMLMIDPKMVELSGYARLPHLMHPVVTDMRKAEAILAWACEKMDERYRLLANAGVRHLSSYNQLGEDELMQRLKPETEEEKKLIPRHLPYIVIIADEMADLMMTAGKEVQAHIIRLASKSRAVGIHLILATQRPTADVITGLIKSNLPARVAFQVTSNLDSRVVLDEQGAEKLLGNGDMLFLSPGTSSLLRGQGTFMSDEEIDRIVDYCSSKGEQQFVKELVQLKVEDKDAGEAVEIKKRDELYEQAIEIVIREGRGSVSLLQRNLTIGYGRAARLIDYMAEDGIVGAYNGSKAREVIMTMADLEASRSTGGATAGESSAPVVAPAIDAVARAVTPAVLETKMAKVAAIPNASNAASVSNTIVPAQQEVDDEEEEYEESEEEEMEYEQDELEEGEEDAEAYEEEGDEEEDEYEDAEYEEDEYEEEEYEDEYEADSEEETNAAEPDSELTGSKAQLAAAYAEEQEYEEVEDEFDGDEYEQEDFDSEEFQQAVADQKDIEEEIVETLEEYAAEVAEAKKGLVPKIKKKKGTSKSHRSDGPSTAKNPHQRNSTVRT